MIEPTTMPIGPAGEPTESDLRDPQFQAIWQAIREWDIQRAPGRGYAGATGTDVMTILHALSSAAPDGVG